MRIKPVVRRSIRSSECGVKPPGKNIHRPTVGVVAGVDDELIVEGDFRQGGQSVVVISFDDLLWTGMRQLPVNWRSMR